jgi:Phage integrase family
MLDTVDFTANPAAPEFDGYGMLSVRYGKAAKGSPPRRRNVLTVMGWAAEVVAEWVEQVRGCYGPGQRTMLWPTERGGRVSGAYIGLRFDTFRDALGLPGEPRPHCLRHAYVTHLVEDGFDPFFVQQQVGHAWGSTTRGPGLSSDWWPRATTGSPPPARMAARTADPCGGVAARRLLVQHGLLGRAQPGRQPPDHRAPVMLVWGVASEALRDIITGSSMRCALTERRPGGSIAELGTAVRSALSPCSVPSSLRESGAGRVGPYLPGSEGASW